MNESRRTRSLSRRCKSPSRLTVMGLGYIGLPTASLFAREGFQVTGCDRRREVVESIHRGETPLEEPGLGELVRQVVNAKRLRASLEPAPADVFLIAVGTPTDAEHRPDLSQVESATRALAPYLEAGNLVIIESTSPVGTSENVSRWLAEERPDLSFPHQASESASIDIAYCPERVLPSRVLDELVNNDRVIGGLTAAGAERAAAFYRRVVTGHCHLTDARTAEMVKLVENSFRDVNIAFANELSVLCDKARVDVWELIELANRHPRVSILSPGPGVGGHCVAVDPWFLVQMAPAEARLIRMAREVNDAKPEVVVDKVLEAALDREQPVIACLGLTFKANTDDLRESPALEIVKTLAEREVGTILAVEPHAAAPPVELIERGVMMTGAREAMERADVIVLLVDHDEFRALGDELPVDAAVIDTRGLWRHRRPSLRRPRPSLALDPMPLRPRLAG